MAITQVGADIGGGNVVTITDLNWPTGLQANDTAILSWTFASARIPNTPSGFTIENDVDGGAGGMTAILAWKTLVGDETGSLSVSTDATANRQSAVLWVIRGANPTDPISAFANDTSHVAGTTYNNPAVTPLDNDCIVIACIHHRASEPDNHTSFSTAPGAVPSSYTLIGDSQGLASGTGGTTTAMAHDGLSSGRDLTAVTPGVWTGNDAVGTNGVITRSVAIKPAAVGFTGLKVASGSTWVDAAQYSSVGSLWS